MNKKLMAVAVGAALAPGLALAQSSVTISGYVKTGVDNIRYSGANTPVAGNTTRAQSSESRVTDHSSRIIFNITEDLGGGMQAIAQIDSRFNPADITHPASGGYSAVLGGGNTWVGINSKSFGRVTFGRHDLHYGKAGDNTADKAGSLLLIASSIFDVVGRPLASTGERARSAVVALGGGMAGQTRTNNVVRWDTPQWGIFSATVAWSANGIQPGAGGQNVEGDLHLSNGNTASVGTANTGLVGTGPNAGSIIRRRGEAWNLNPRLTGSNWMVEYSYWKAKQDTNVQSSVTFTPIASIGAANSGTAGTNVVQHDQRSDVLAGNMRFGGFKIGLAWNRSKTTDPASGYTSGNRKAWSIPASYTWGPHSVAGHWTKVGNSRDVVVAGATTANDVTVSGSDTGATMWAIAYDYSLSKRTSMGVSYGSLRNKSNAGYGMFYNVPSAFGSASNGTLPGEDIRLLAATVRHNF